MTKLIVVIGATGGQGGSVVDAFIGNPEYQIRGITRNTSGTKAKNLKERGVEVVSADLNDEASLLKAFEGAAVIFAVTDFWEPFDTLGADAAMEIETKQGINVARAAAQIPSLEHFVWSTLPNGRAVSGGKHIVPHFESKNRIDDFIRADKDLHAKTTYLLVGFYASNVNYPMFAPIKLEAASKRSSSKYAWLQPIGGSAGLGVGGDHNVNVGLTVARIIARPDLTLPSTASSNSKFVILATEFTTFEGILKLWGEATGNETVYVQVSLKEYDAMWPRWGHEMGLMLKYMEESSVKGWGLGPGEDLVNFEDLEVEGMVGEFDALKKMSV